MLLNSLNSGSVKHFYIVIVSLQYTCDLDIVLILQMKKLGFKEVKFFTDLQNRPFQLYSQYLALYLAHSTWSTNTNE